MGRRSFLKRLFISAMTGLCANPLSAAVGSSHLARRQNTSEQSKWGFIDKSGNVVISPKFDSAPRLELVHRLGC